MFFLIFQCMWRHGPLKEYSVLVGIRAEHTFLISLRALSVITQYSNQFIGSLFCSVLTTLKLISNTISMVNWNDEREKQIENSH